jgi:hypothetical protein
MPFSGVWISFYLWIFRYSVGLLWGGSVQRQGLYLHRTTQHREPQTHIHAPSRIRNCDPNVRAAEDSTCLRSRGYWDRLKLSSILFFKFAFPWIIVVQSLMTSLEYKIFFTCGWNTNMNDAVIKCNIKTIHGTGSEWNAKGGFINYYELPLCVDTAVL